ncbi:lipid A export permease/ATP-binding protein MsbA [Pseudoalteromonas spongiae]|uniref:lipid A export permease/ATP-binding protein MsbA n=1 Tax=Pseudoalteromonas spongiae TaxID=298657 RepID=UPI00026CDA4F|nr:lipid A export permease/ATP-binding protein MsbA [Pseudoalteromonas spongiae]ATC98764.1 ATP-binding cassette, subfamily B, bacterial MsbA [Pseudoalteromonas spongiae UST010723-006]
MTTSSDYYKRLLTYVKPHKLAATFAIIGMLGYAAMDGLFVYLMDPFIEQGLTAKNQEVMKWAPVVVILLVLFRGVFNFVSSYCLANVGSHVVMAIRKELFAKLLHLPVSFHDQHSTGELISKITFDAEQVQTAITKALITIVREGAFVIFLVINMLIASWQLSLLFILVVPIVAGIVSIVSKRFRVIAKRIQDAMGGVTRASEQMVKGHKVIHSFGGQEIEQQRFADVNNRNRQQRVKMDATKALSVASIQIIAASAIAMVLAAIGFKLVEPISTGAFVSLLTAMMMMLRPLKQLSNVNVELQRGIAAAKSIFDILDLENEKDTGSKTLEKCQGHITIESLSFAYPNTERNILNELTMDIKPGQSVALVGRSGSGKSTLSNLLPRFYDTYTNGDIKLDGLSVNTFDLTWLREQFAIVSQQVVLFNDTIENNITYGFKGDITPEKLQKIVEQSHVWEFVKDLPGGLQTIVGEDGVMLSGGQRQRIAIARALLKNAPILILDEATSALDTESEKLIQHALNDLMKGRTSIVIAHRLSTIENSDVIYVLDKGQIIESGSHAELIEKQGAYLALQKMQAND